MARKVSNIEEQLRQAVADSGQTIYAVAKGSGANYSVLLRFMAQERGISLRTAARLTAYLKLELQPVKGR